VHKSKKMRREMSLPVQIVKLIGDELTGACTSEKEANIFNHITELRQDIPLEVLSLPVQIVKLIGDELTGACTSEKEN